MGEAFFWGLVAGSSLLLGGVLALRVAIAPRTLGLVMGFGSGVLISAVAYELALEAFEASSGTWQVAGGLFAGSLTFYAGDWVIERMGGEMRKNSGGAQAGEHARRVPGPGPDLEHAFLPGQLERLADRRDDPGLRDRLALADGPPTAARAICSLPIRAASSFSCTT